MCSSLNFFLKKGHLILQGSFGIDHFVLGYM